MMWLKTGSASSAYPMAFIAPSADEVAQERSRQARVPVLRLPQGFHHQDRIDHGRQYHRLPEMGFGDLRPRDGKQGRLVDRAGKRPQHHARVGVVFGVSHPQGIWP